MSGMDDDAMQARLDAAANRIRPELQRLGAERGLRVHVNPLNMRLERAALLPYDVEPTPAIVVAADDGTWGATRQVSIHMAEDADGWQVFVIETMAESIKRRAT